MTEEARRVEKEWSPWARMAITRLRFRTSRRRVALVISGGGSLGAFEAGALRFLYDHVDVKPFAFCGNSVGAITAAKLAEGDDPATGRRAVEEIEQIWRAMKSNADMWEMEPWLEKLRSSASWASELREQVLERQNAAAQGRLVLRVLASVVRRAPETDGTLHALRQALNADSLLSNQPVIDLVHREIHPERIAASGLLLRLGTVSLESGQLRYVTETGAMVDRDNAPIEGEPVSLLDAAIASSSIPLVFPPVRLNDEHYVDGGVREITPLELPFAHLGAEQIFAVSAAAVGVDPAPSFAGRGMLDIARRVMTEIGPDEIMRKELHPPRGWGRRVSLVYPEFDVHDSMTIDPVLIGISIDYGWMRAADELLGLDDRARANTAAIAKVRARLREIEGPVDTLLGPPAEEVPGAQAEGEREVLLPQLSELLEQRRVAALPLPPGTDRWGSE